MLVLIKDIPNGDSPCKIFFGTPCIITNFMVYCQFTIVIFSGASSAGKAWGKACQISPGLTSPMMQIYPHCDGFLPKDNILVKATMCFCKSCFWCLEKFMKFLNRLEIQLGLPFVTALYIYWRAFLFNFVYSWKCCIYYLRNAYIILYIIAGMPISSWYILS